MPYKRNQQIGRLMAYPPCSEATGRFQRARSLRRKSSCQGAWPMYSADNTPLGGRKNKGITLAVYRRGAAEVEFDLGLAGLLAGLALFVHIFDRGFVDHQIGGAGAVHLDASAVVPLDHAMDLLTVGEHNDHGGLRLHLLLIIKILRVGLLRRRCLPCPIGAVRTAIAAFTALASLTALCGSTVRMVRSRVVGVVEGGTDQLAVGEILFRTTFGWHGLHNILHGNTCWTRFLCGHTKRRAPLGY